MTLRSPQDGLRESNNGLSGNKKSFYSSQEIQNISGLGDVLRSIRARLIRDGVSLDKERRKILLKRKKLAII
ncbi:hypothetical protein A3D42_00400 [Candidatus Nomurabacteria bacterium RIFCSPHIGHO2_02_FULL_41_18]|uniref:Uncharacterized protein n=1 Tax=Candidatus Nomurabacteria bacterium RIFCSPHIGHO2_02_FULL_41_18 TaxID=1801754 RepID=A0A1F6W7N6_9BACT|nr:MAG: hypothetical protein A2737_02320 [Candidatus Nomurabacteria bacterium RIFCSPHIGHO2_01_FULL_41_71]OGI77960.1 MAG: hypothetical protein A3D42_00400 [Candidatus Nomurabacteria bacterium RIFCSPHIGHO2_02_FULL_41_18]OGI89548.1 MAG: hypothetical protein A3B01_00135 [Candidatus Nomurabacteria bacterium RIFCSPLOWO2_01_FULL_41_52b]